MSSRILTHSRLLTGLLATWFSMHAFETHTDPYHTVPLTSQHELLNDPAEENYFFLLRQRLWREINSFLVDNDILDFVEKVDVILTPAPCVRNVCSHLQNLKQ